MREGPEAVSVFRGRPGVSFPPEPVWVAHRVFVPQTRLPHAVPEDQAAIVEDVVASSSGGTYTAVRRHNRTGTMTLPITASHSR
jgi:hypothetical protein